MQTPSSSSFLPNALQTLNAIFVLCLIAICVLFMPIHAIAQQTVETKPAQETTNEQAATDEVEPESPSISIDPNLPKFIAKYATRSITHWEDDVARLEAKNGTQRHPEDAVLFIGSSSIRRWDSIAEDMAPYIPIQRGYGGARYSDLAYFAERLITPHKYQAVVMFVANDVQNDKNDEDTSIEDIDALVRHIVSVSAQHAPGKPFLIVEVTPTMSRRKVWDKTRKLNAILREICLSTPDTFFVETAESFLTDNKEPLERYFVKDRLHLNADGYDLWADLIRSELKNVLERSKAYE